MKLSDVVNGISVLRDPPSAAGIRSAAGTLYVIVPPCVLSLESFGVQTISFAYVFPKYAPPPLAL